MKSRSPRNEQRSFGISVGIVLLVIAALLWWRGRPVRAEVVGGLGVFLVAAGLIYPPILKYPSAAWWRFSRVLGHFNARVILTLMFSLVLVPLSIVWRITGKDPLARRRGSWRGWSAYPARYRNPKHYERMF